MSDRIDPPSELAARLFDAERARPAGDPEQAARLLARVGATVGVVAVVGSAAGTAAAGTAAGAAAHAGTAAKLGLSVKAAPWIAVAFLAGGGTGAAVHAVAVRATPPPVPIVATPTPPSRPVAAPPSSDAPELPELDPAPEPVATSVGPKPIASRLEVPPAPSADTGLAGERALIDRARMALARGQAASALEALDAHRSQFPQGRLAEEREALSIQALAALGRGAEARRRADAFTHTHPNSVFLPAIELATAGARKIDAGP